MEQKLWKSACAGANGAELGSGAEAQLVRGKTQSNTQRVLLLLAVFRIGWRLRNLFQITFQHVDYILMHFTF